MVKRMAATASRTVYFDSGPRRFLQVDNMGISRQQEQQRLRIAMEAAKHMSDSGVSDYQLAKRKACQKLGVVDRRNLPSNQEIKDALFEYQSLFKSEQQPQQLRHMRETAVQAMQFFQQFNPRLAGDVLDGSATEHSRLELHLFADYTEKVGLFLMQEKIPYTQKQRRITYDGDRYEFIPIYMFLADDVAIELVVFPVEAIRRAPNSTLDGKPMVRADIKAVERLLQADTQ